MIKHSRNLILDVFDYNGNKLCNLYDNSIDASGQAYDVFVKTERNGWRELNFNLPSTMQTENGKEPNYRLDFIKADYRIRLTDDDGIDWFLITQPTQNHKGVQKDYSIRAGHISQLLKTKKLDLEFTDNEGNNVGTPKEFLDYILEGTGWTSGLVDVFYEEKDQYDLDTYYSPSDDMHCIWTDNATAVQYSGTGRTQEEAYGNLLTTLAGHNLNVSDGYIKYRILKRRSLKASAKSGAFKLISMMCDLFDAKPIYHGDTQTVDIVPINPFSAPIDGSLPDVTKADGVIELQYSSNIKNVTRTLNSENLVTKLYAYGSYGDNTYGYCGIDECSHIEHVFTLSSSISVGRYYKFSIRDESGTLITRRFKVDKLIPVGSKIYYSFLDPTSMMYVWIESSSSSTFADIQNLYWSEISNNDWTKITSKVNTNGHAYILENNSEGYDLPYSEQNGHVIQTVKNWFSFVTDFEYFQEVNLLTDNCLQKLAGYQRFAKAFYQIIHDKSLQLSDELLDLSETIGEVNFCKLSFETYSIVNGCLKVKLNKTDEYPEGIIYRSDYETSKKNRFTWNTTPTIKSNGDASTSGASILYIIHSTNPITWDTAYLKAIDNEDNPTYLTFHTDKEINLNTDKFYLFQSNNINGKLGSLQTSDESTLASINNQLKVVTVSHDIQFYPNASSIPSNITLISDTTHNTPEWFKLDEYAWAWDYGASQLYFCYYDHYGTNTERSFVPVYFQNTEPSVSGICYWYNWTTSTLYRYSGSSWTAINGKKEITITSKFGAIYKACKDREKFYKGLPEYYSHYNSSILPVGNYYIETAYNDMYVFSLKEALSSGTTVRLNTNNKTIETFSGSTTSPALTASNFTAEFGSININTGDLILDDSKCRSRSFISVTPGEDYTFKGFTSAIPLTVCKYQYVGGQYNLIETVPNVSGYDGIISIENNITHIKLLCDVDYRTFNSYSNFCAYRGQMKVIECKAYRFDNVKYYPTNSYNTIAESGYINTSTYQNINGQDVTHIDDGYYDNNQNWIDQSYDVLNHDYDKDYCRSVGFIEVKPGAQYRSTSLVVVDSNNVSRWCPMRAVYYDIDKKPINQDINIHETTFIVPNNAYYIKIIAIKPNDYVLPEGKTFADMFNYFMSEYTEEDYWPYRLYNIHTNDAIIIQDKDYIKLSVTASSSTNGINSLMSHFSSQADLCYITHYPALKDAQNALESFSTALAIELGDMYREGYWQKTDYVDGDEKKLYNDAIDTIKVICKPIASYNIDYLDLYESNQDMNYSLVEDTAISWPDLSIMSAAHLVDDEIDISCWAYIDTINKCYDKPWKTQISINTEMSTMAQHTFADVIANIADVANRVKARDELIDRVTVINRNGTINTKRLQGAIDAANLKIFSSKSKMYTDDMGRLVFESEDGSSAMVLTGTGLAVSSAKDANGNFVYRTCITGYGITADEITTGYLDAERIKADSITVDKLSSTVGNELEISSNKAIVMNVTNINKLDNRMSSAELKITPTAIKSVVKDINNLDNYYTSSQIDQLSDSITLSVYRNVDSHVMGGRNLIIGTKDMTSIFGYASIDTENRYNDFAVLYSTYNNWNATRGTLTVDIEPDSYYIMSFYAKGSGTTSAGFYGVRGSTVQHVIDTYQTSTGSSGTIGQYDDYVNYTIPSSWTRLWFKFKTRSNFTKCEGHINISYHVNENAGYIYICGLKVEKGETVTDWSPAPEDLDARISAAEFKIQDDQIRSTVSSMFNNYYTKSQIDQTADSITMTVSNNYLGKNSPAVGVSTSSLTIDSDGISMAGGTIEMTASSNFIVSSGGVVRIEATKQDGSYISFGDGDFIIGQNGNVTAKTGTFKESLYIGSNRVLTTNDIGEVLNQKIIVSDTQPSGHNILWFKPTGQSSGSSVISSDISQSFYCNSSSISTWTTMVKGYGGGATSKTFPLVKSDLSSITAMGDGPYKYTVSFEMRKHSDSDFNAGYIYFDVDLEACLVNSANYELSLGTVTSTAQTYGSAIVNFSITSSTNLLSANTASSVSLKVYFKKAYTGSTMAIEISKSSIRATCSCSSTSSSSGGGSSSSGVTQCEVYYIN